MCIYEGINIDMIKINLMGILVTKSSYLCSQASRNAILKSNTKCYSLFYLCVYIKGINIGLIKINLMGILVIKFYFKCL